MMSRAYFTNNAILKNMRIVCEHFSATVKIYVKMSNVHDAYHFVLHLCECRENATSYFCLSLSLKTIDYQTTNRFGLKLGTRQSHNYENALVFVTLRKWREELWFQLNRRTALFVDRMVAAFLHCNNSMYIYFQWNYFYQCYKINPVGKCLCNTDGGPNGRFSEHCSQRLCIDFNDVLTWARKHNTLKEKMWNDESITTVHWYFSYHRRSLPTHHPSSPYLSSLTLPFFLSSFAAALCSHFPLAFFSQIAFETIHFCRQGLFATAKHCKSCTAYGSLSLIYFHFSHFLLLAIMSLWNGSVNIVM